MKVGRKLSLSSFSSPEIFIELLRYWPVLRAAAGNGGEQEKRFPDPMCTLSEWLIK